MVLYMDHDEVVTFNSMESTILGHLAASVNYYNLFHIGDILNDAERYLKFGTLGQCTQCNCCCHSKSSKVEPHNISERAKRKHTNSQAYYTYNRQKGSLEIYM